MAWRGVGRGLWDSYNGGGHLINKINIERQSSGREGIQVNELAMGISIFLHATEHADTNVMLLNVYTPGGG